MKIAAYCRVSTDKEQQLESLENQKTFFTEFASKQNHELFRIYADEGISGKQMKNRTEFLKMLQDAKLHMFDMVVVKDISRFARNTVDFLNSVRELKSENIEVQFLSTNQTILGNSEFILTIFSALAQEESANLSKRVKFGMSVSAQKGKVPNIIYGYDIVNAQTLSINDQEAEVVRDIFNMYVNQGLGARRIGLTLDSKGIRTKKGTTWIPKTIRRILSNPIYTGILINHKYVTTDFLSGKKDLRPESENFIHERPDYVIVSKDIFEKAQIILKQHQETYRNLETHKTGRYSNKYLFSTLIRCEHCGYSFVRRKYTSKKRGDIIYWRCSGNNNRTSDFCPNCINVYENDLIEKLKEYLSQFISNRDKIIELASKEFEKKYSVTTSKTELKQSIKQLDKLKLNEEKYKTMFANDIITIDELKGKINEINLQKTELQRVVETQQALEQKLKNKSSIINSKIKDIESFLTSGIYDNQSLREILTNITVNKDGVITFNLKLFEL